MGVNEMILKTSKDEKGHPYYYISNGGLTKTYQDRDQAIKDFHDISMVPIEEIRLNMEVITCQGERFITYDIK